MDEAFHPTGFPHRSKRGVYMDASGALAPPAELQWLERFDLTYRTLVAILYNFVPRSGHPGGSVSMSRILSWLLFSVLEQDPARPLRPEQDQLVLAAGHKAMGLYAMLALRDEILRVWRPDLLPPDSRHRLRLEDLLGFRRNPEQDTPLFRRLGSKALDGHPTPATPFVPVATGPSGVGVASAVGLALALADTYGPGAPRVHVIEGEGGMTPGRVSEAMACASASELSNLMLHVDYNQSTIDSDRCCRENGVPGDYVQWDPAELAHLHDFNVITVTDGFSFAQLSVALTWASRLETTQPTCIVYRTVKGWRYGIEGRRSHGAGHDFCGPGYQTALEPFEKAFGIRFPRFSGEATSERIERTYWDSLVTIRKAIETDPEMAEVLGTMVQQGLHRLERRGRAPRDGAPRLQDFLGSRLGVEVETPPELILKAGTKTTLREQLGASLGFIGRRSAGGVMAAAADLLDSTSVARITDGMDGGFYSVHTNPSARIVSAGGITEDAMGAIAAGISTMGTHLGVSSSYAAFIAPLSHIASRCHAIGQEARRGLTQDPPNPFVIVMAHSSVLTGEDGPTHADPQALQLYQENFPDGLCMTLTPTEPSEVWPLLAAAIAARPAVVAVFVTRPQVVVPHRTKLGLPPATQAGQGAVRVRSGSGEGGAVIIQGSGAATEFYQHVLPRLDAEDLDLDIVVVTCMELLLRLPTHRRENVLPAGISDRAMGITDFTLPTLYGLVTTGAGREASLHPFRKGRFLGSGSGAMVMRQAGLDAASQLEAIRMWSRRFRHRH